MLTLMIATAVAADRVLDLDGDTDLAVVAQLAGLDAPPTPITTSDLAQRPAQVLGGGLLTWCTGAPTDAATLAEAMAQAEGDIAYMEFEAAAKTLGSAFDSLQCLADPVDPVVAARLFYLRGLVAHRSGFDEASSKAFAIAFIFQPDLVWDDAFPPKALSLFQQAKEVAGGLETVHVALRPGGTVTVDGQDLSVLDLAPGTHLLQLSGQTATLQVYPGTAPRLVLPALFTGVESIADPDAQATLLALAGDDTLWVIDQGHVWSPTPDGYQDLGKLPRARAEREARPEPVPKAPKETAGGARFLLPAGGAVALGGAALGTAALFAARSAATDARETASYDDYTGFLGLAESRARISQVGYGVAVVGGALALTGVVLTDDRGWSLLPTPGGLLLTVTQ